MLKKLVNGEYSLKACFWIFGILGFSLFFILSAITHSMVVGAVCRIQKICSFNVIKYIFFNFVNLLIGGVSGIMPYLVAHLIMSAIFLVYMYITLRGLWKSCANYEGKSFWCWSAKLILFVLALGCFKSIV
ncbi:MAG: hypothetical protein J6039_04990 [Alphaproteobacteria bacterium]|nr:hypothetical protein [Alphaproteobacteria bacterium]